MNDSIIVVGTGWAGLTTACSLAKQGIKVTLLEASEQVGGSDRAFAWKNPFIEGTHPHFLGCHHQLLSFLHSIGVPETTVFHREPFRLKGYDTDRTIEVKLPDLIPPLNWIVGFMTATGLEPEERKKLLALCRGVSNIQFEIQDDQSVLELLQSFKQTEALIKLIWEPLTLSILATPLQQASGKIFLKLLKQLMTGASQNSNLLIPKVDLNEILPIPVLRYLEKYPVQIVYNQTVQKLTLEDEIKVQVKTQDRIWYGSKVILAISPQQASALIPDLPNCAVLKETLLQFNQKSPMNFNQEPSFFGFLSEVNIELKQVSQQTPLRNLLLAGDYTQCGNPAGFEACVESGLRVAEHVVSSEQIYS